MGNSCQTKSDEGRGPHILYFEQSGTQKTVFDCLWDVVIPKLSGKWLMVVDRYESRWRVVFIYTFSILIIWRGQIISRLTPRHEDLLTPKNVAGCEG